MSLYGWDRPREWDEDWRPPKQHTPFDKMLGCFGALVWGFVWLTYFAFIVCAIFMAAYAAVSVAHYLWGGL